MGAPDRSAGGYKYTRLLAAPNATAADTGGARFSGALAVAAALKLAAELVVALATAVWTVQGTDTGLLDDWDGGQKVEGTVTRPEPGSRELVWAGVAAAWAADVAVCLAALPRIPRVIARVANRQAGAALSWIGLVLMAAAGDAILHHVASNVDSSTGPLMPTFMGLNTAFLGAIAMAVLWDDIQDP